MKPICDLHPWLSRLCAPTFPWDEIIIGAIVSILLVWLISAPKLFFSLLNPRYWKLYGRWQKYGIGFYPEGKTGVHPIYKGNVWVFPMPFGAPALHSSNPTYKYWGRMELVDGTLYINWSGRRHSEKMLSVYKEPLHVNKTTSLLGVKACLTGFGEPAANAEMLTKKILTDEEIRAMLSQSSIVIKTPYIHDANYPTT